MQSRSFSPLRTAAFMAAAAVFAFPAMAQQGGALSGAPAERMTMNDSMSASPTQSLTLERNKSYMIEFDTDLDDVIIANPGIANITARDSRRVAIMGIAPGASNMVFLDRTGRKMLVLDVSVTDTVAGMDELRSLIKRYVPNNKIQVESVNGRVILAGSAPNNMAADRALTLARQYAPEGGVLNMMTIEGKDQVMLKVRIVEMQRSVIKQLGINLSGTIGFGQLTPGGWRNMFEFASTNGFGVAGSPLGGLAASLDDVNYNGLLPQSSLGVNINALERVGVLRTLAEPNLTAISGESAKFLAGGEFPVPVAQDQGTISVQFKPFGVGLGFTPVVMSAGRISLQVSTEVSELTMQGAFQARSVVGVDPDTGEPTVGQSVAVPALKVRRAETTVELPSGGSLVIAGLIQEQTKQSLDGMPGAKDIPVLGALFRSRDFQNDETELVVIVTPYLVDPTDPQNLRNPDSGYVTSRDARTIFFGKLNEVYGVKGGTAGKTPPPQGSSGFIFD